MTKSPNGEAARKLLFMGIGGLGSGKKSSSLSSASSMRMGVGVPRQVASKECLKLVGEKKESATRVSALEVVVEACEKRLNDVFACSGFGSKLVGNC